MTVTTEPAVPDGCIDVIPGLRRLATIGAREVGIGVLTEQSDRRPSNVLIVAIVGGDCCGEGVVYRGPPA